MIKFMVIAAVLVAGPAFAENPDKNTVAGGGTFAGQTPRGQSVSAYSEITKNAGFNYGQTWAVPRTQEAHGQPGPGSEVANDIQGHLAQDANATQNSIVGYGRIGN